MSDQQIILRALNTHEIRESNGTFGCFREDYPVEENPVVYFYDSEAAAWDSVEIDAKLLLSRDRAVYAKTGIRFSR